MRRLPSCTFPVGLIVGFCLIFSYFYFFNQFWTHISTTRLQALTEYQGHRFRGYRGRQILVHREFRPVMQRLEFYAASRQVHILITGSFRPPEQKISNAVVAPAVRSNHLAGHAVDFNIVHEGKVYESEDLNKAAFYRLPEPVKQFIGDIRQDSGMRWGGDFETEDPVHLDDALNIRHADAWNIHYRVAVADYMHAELKWIMWAHDMFSL